MNVLYAKQISHNITVCPNFYELVSKNDVEFKTYVRYLFVWGLCMPSQNITHFDSVCKDLYV